MKNMVKKTKILLAALSALLLMTSVQSASAQDPVAGNGFSPYSLFGFGDLPRQGTSYNLSMGGIGIGDRNVRYINLLNPAGVTAREAKSFMMDFGLENRNVLYQGNAATSLSETASGVLKSGNNTFNMHHIAVTLPIAQFGAFKLGMAPYSTVSYKFQADESSDALIAEAGDIRYTKEGTGGIYQAFAGVGVTLWKRLSLGADLDYYFGKIDRKSTAVFRSTASYRSLSSGWRYNVSCFSGKFGLQYEQPFSNAMSAVVGLTYSLPTRLRGGEERYAYGETSSVTDTIISRKVSLADYRMPAELGAGVSLRYGEKWMVGFDYTRADWTGIDFGGYPGIDFTTGVARNFRGGFEITPNRYDVRRGHWLRRLTYRVGAYHELSHLYLNGSRIVANGVTAGVGIPVFRYYNSINLGVELGQRGTLQNNLVRERYFLFTLSFNLHDIWFIPTLYN